MSRITEQMSEYLVNKLSEQHIFRLIRFILYHSAHHIFIQHLIYAWNISFSLFLSSVYLIWFIFTLENIQTVA